MTLFAAAMFAMASCTSADGPAADETDLEDLDPATLHWVSPLAGDPVVVNEGFEMGVFTQNTAARVIHFAVDGHEIGVCDPTQPDEDCHEEQSSYFTAEIATAGAHTVSAWFEDAQHHRQTITRDVTVLATAPPRPDLNDLVVDEPLPDDTQFDEIEDDSADDDLGPAGEDITPLVLDGDSTIVEGISLRRHASRGYLDPSHGFRSFAGGIEYRVSHQRVILRNARIDGSAPAACRCERRYHDAIVAHADLQYMSRASVLAALLAADNCDTDAGSVATNAFIRGRTCISVARAAGMTITAEPGHTAEWSCREHMATSTFFAAQIVATYLSRPAVIRRHLFDPPRIAAVLSTGSVRRTHANRWHMHSRADYISRFVGAYNAYRTQEVGGQPPNPPNFSSAYNRRLPNPIGGNRARRQSIPACAGDLARHNGACTRWPITTNPVLRDGFGNDRGVITDTYAQINYGLRRDLVGEPHLYVFAAHIRDASGAVGRASGWMPQSAVTDASIANMPDVVATAPSGTFTEYTLSGAAESTSFWVTTPGVERDRADRKLRLAYTSGGSNASDYYVRRTFSGERGVVNILFGLPGNGGVSSDTVPISTADQPVHFFAADNVAPVSSYLYPPCSENSDQGLQFVYGYVETPFGRRFGWIARANLTP